MPINLLSGVGYVEQYGASPKQIIADNNRCAYLHIGFFISCNLTVVERT
ncbi:hypothetical protein ENHY17A_50142 [Moraxellaceae bacterium 17A]|nr:hypothetical protein ENHY17A_50142 [Moraxellaceae bacterium 17A]